MATRFASMSGRASRGVGGRHDVGERPRGPVAMTRAGGSPARTRWTAPGPAAARRSRGPPSATGSTARTRCSSCCSGRRAPTAAAAPGCLRRRPWQHQPGPDRLAVVGPGRLEPAGHRTGVPGQSSAAGGARAGDEVEAKHRGGRSVQRWPAARTGTGRPAPGFRSAYAPSSAVTRVTSPGVQRNTGPPAAVVGGEVQRAGIGRPGAVPRPAVRAGQQVTAGLAARLEPRRPGHRRRAGPG